MARCPEHEPLGLGLLGFACLKGLRTWTGTVTLLFFASPNLIACESKILLTIKVFFHFFWFIK